MLLCCLFMVGGKNTAAEAAAAVAVAAAARKSCLPGHHVYFCNTSLVRKDLQCLLWRPSSKSFSFLFYLKCTFFASIATILLLL